MQKTNIQGIKLKFGRIKYINKKISFIFVCRLKSRFDAI